MLLDQPGGQADRLAPEHQRVAGLEVGLEVAAGRVRREEMQALIGPLVS